MLDAYDLSGVGILADIGGGNGTNLIGILGRYPAMRGLLFDLPHVVERARANAGGGGAVAGRCEVVGGDFFEAIPVGADAYFLRHIIHDWDDEKAGLHPAERPPGDARGGEAAGRRVRPAAGRRRRRSASCWT